MANIQKRGENSWYLTVNLGKDSNNKYIRRTKTVKCRTKREAESEYAKFRQEVEAGAYIAPEKMTFSAFLDEWKNKYALRHLEAKTMYVYDQILDNHIIPAIGHLRLDQVKPMHIISYLETLSQDGIRKDRKNGGMSTGTIQYHHRVLKNVFTRAVEWKIIKSNPAADVKRPKVTHKEIVPYDETEIQELLFALQNEPYH